jgi:hypothetical protein
MVCIAPFANARIGANYRPEYDIPVRGKLVGDGGQSFVDGGDGTIVFYRAPPAGTLFLIR